jgi:hypothetical protein
MALLISNTERIRDNEENSRLPYLLCLVANCLG